MRCIRARELVVSSGRSRARSRARQANPRQIEIAGMDAKLLDILVCPMCKGPLLYKKAEKELICRPAGSPIPIKDDIPVMLEDEARKLPPEEEV